MKYWLRSFFIFLVSLQGFPVMGHELGIISAVLTESDKASVTAKADERQFQFDVMIPFHLAYQVSLPDLPEQCQMRGTERVSGALDVIRYRFACRSKWKHGDKLTLHWQASGVLLTAPSLGYDTRERQLLLRADERIVIPLFQQGEGYSGDWLSSISRYLTLGIEHIVFGYDHLLFVFAIYLMLGSSVQLIKSITAFTLAHSLTLSLVYLSFFTPSSALVETLIALSIVMMAHEIMLPIDQSSKLGMRSPWLVAGSIGLLHGMGFAGALKEIGIPQAEVPVALLFFNLGVEIGQISFLAVLSVISLFIPRLYRYASGRRWAIAPSAITYPLAGCVGGVGMYWFLQRVMDIAN
ncbi:HupE/UreJ family protein [Corallincola holothuriorum]|uniref:HupE/UreJ family protein n=1 Tax=Corallincola holothuriorum TaxID=2282215 RepID=A0A368NL79_9GAMM|nr:HupE/UreJ family protein [Corallincola holothuriorum]RCU50916.1 HupE/UreJ family protein [Corallincola holothuriorum]